MGTKNKLKLENKKDIIIEKINNDISLTQIAKELDSGITAVRAIVTKYMPDKTFTFNKPKLDKVKEQVYLDYIKEPDMKKLAIKYNCSPAAIKTAILKVNPIQKCSYDRGIQNYFEVIDSSNKAYLAGFITADGALVEATNSNSIALTITIHKKDRDILEFLRKELKCDNPIIELKRDNLIRFTLSSKKLSNDLIRLGIVPRKSLVLGSVYKNIPNKYQKAFLLGYFDGDGCICYSRRKFAISIRGTKEFLQGYNYVFNFEQNIRKHDSTYTICTSKKAVLKSFYTAYTENPPDFYFQRKYIKFKDFMEKYYQDKTISSSST